MSKNIERLDANKTNKPLAALLTGFYTAAVCAIPALATGDTSVITSGINSGAEQMWNILVGIVGPIAAVALAVCAVKILWGGQRAAEEAKNTAVKIVVAVAIVLMAPSLIKTIGGWFSKSSFSDVTGAFG